jgi:hypothetical protein
MSDREQNKRDNDALQSGEGNQANDQDAGNLGAGGQTVMDTQGESSPKDRQVGGDDRAS